MRIGTSEEPPYERNNFTNNACRKDDLMGWEKGVRRRRNPGGNLPEQTLNGGG